MSQAKTDRLYRLVGDGNSGGGLPLPPLFVSILERLLDQGPATETDLTTLVADRIRKRERCARLYGGADPWGGLTRDALDQLADRDVVQQDGGYWRLGPAFKADEKLLIIGARKGKNEPTAVTVYSPDRRKTLAKAEVQQMEVISAAARLRPDGPGLRPVGVKRRQELADSMRAFGYLEAHPILVDQYGRILDGRHRKAAAEDADKDPKYRMVQVKDDYEALAVVWTANETSSWTRSDRERIGRLLQADGTSVEAIARVLTQADKRAEIEKELRADPQRTDRAIARQIGCSAQTVTAVRRDLEANAQIEHYTERRTDDGSAAPGRKAQAPEPTLIQLQADKLTEILNEEDGPYTLPEITEELNKWRSTQGKNPVTETSVSHRLGELPGGSYHCVKIGKEYRYLPGPDPNPAPPRLERQPSANGEVQVRTQPAPEPSATDQPGPEPAPPPLGGEITELAERCTCTCCPH